MKRLLIPQPMRRFCNNITALFIVAAIMLWSCGDSGHKQDKTGEKSPVMGPAPDNNSATNPSLADTAYKKDSTKGRDTAR